MKKVKVSIQTFEEIKQYGHGVPRTEDRHIQENFSVGKEYLIHVDGSNEQLHVRCTRNCPTHLRVIEPTSMKKGVQYSHYVGGDLMEIQSAIDNATCGNLSDYFTGEEATQEYWAEYAKRRITELRNKIAQLDQINGITDY